LSGSRRKCPIALRYRLDHLHKGGLAGGGFRGEAIGTNFMSGANVRPAFDPRMLRALYFEDLHLGMRETLMKTVMETDVVGFARLSGDENPIHLCDVYAAQTRFGQRIAHGLYTASLISAVLGTRLPGPGAVYRSQTLNFHAPVKIGDVVTVTVEVVELVASGRRVKLACEALIDGQVVLDGEAVVSVPSRHTRPRA